MKIDKNILNKYSISWHAFVYRIAVLSFFSNIICYNLQAQDHIKMDFVFVSSNSTQADFDIVLTNDGTTILKFNSIVMRGNNDSIENIASPGSIVSASALQNNAIPAWTISSDTWPGSTANVAYFQGGTAFKLNFSSNNQYFTAGNRPSLPIGIPVNIGRFRLSVASGNWIPDSQLNFTWHSLAGVVCENSVGTLITMNSSPSSITKTVSLVQTLNPSLALGAMSGNDTICAAIQSANISAAITGGTNPFQLVYTNGTVNDTINNYINGAPITVSPSVSTTYTIVSINGNTAGHSGSASIVIITSSPVPNAASLSAINANCSVASIPPPSATSACYGSITGSTNVTFPITAQGITNLTWTYDDGNGNITTQTQQIIITDNSAPVPDVSTLPSLTGNCSLGLTPPTATDACMGVITAVSNVSSPITNPGLTVVTWTYNDGNGNTETQTQNVTINAPNTAVSQIGGTLTAISSTATYQWLDCNDNYAVITGATNQSFTPSVLSGDYALEVTEFGCSDTSTCYNVNLTGLEESIPIIEIRIYPNPTADKFNVDVFGLNQINLKMEITDMTGRKILSEELENLSGNYSKTVDISKHENGIYIINLISDKGVILSKRIVKF